MSANLNIGDTFEARLDSVSSKTTTIKVIATKVEYARVVGELPDGRVGEFKLFPDGWKIMCYHRDGEAA